MFRSLFCGTYILSLCKETYFSQALKCHLFKGNNGKKINNKKDLNSRNTGNDVYSGDRYSGNDGYSGLNLPDDELLFTVSGITAIADKK